MFFEKYLSKIFDLETKIFALLSLDCKSSLCILDIRSYKIYDSKIFFYSMGYFSFLTMFSDAYKFLKLKILVYIYIFSCL